MLGLPYPVGSLSKLPTLGVELFKRRLFLWKETLLTLRILETLAVNTLVQISMSKASETLSKMVLMHVSRTVKSSNFHFS